MKRRNSGWGGAIAAVLLALTIAFVLVYIGLTGDRW